MVSIRFVVATFWPLGILLVLLALAAAGPPGAGVESAVLIALVVIQALVGIYQFGKLRGEVKGLRASADEE